jgi:capsid assembly protease
MSGSGLAAVHAAANFVDPAAAAQVLQHTVPGAAAAAPGNPAAAPATTVADLAAAYPDLCAAIRCEGAAAERDRIVGIEAHAMPGHEALIATMKADPAVTPDMAAGRILAAERAARSGQLQAIVNVENVTSKVTASPTTAPVASSPAKPDAHQLASRAREYQAEQSKLGNKISVAQAVVHVEKHG